MGPDAEIDRLYGLPLDEFVAARSDLAKRLRRDGDREGAERVKGLRKPTVGAWALNQVVRRRPRERDKLLAAGERLREAHEALLAGGDPARLRKAMAAERKLADALADAAEAIATESGRGGAALKERVRGTLRAAALDQQARDELAAGRLVRERDAVGLGPFGPEGAATTRRASRRDAGGGASGRERAQRKRAAREQGERDRKRQVAAAERSLAAAHSALAKAEAAHESASGDVEAARRALRQLEAAEREARTAKRERAKDVAKREREIERLRGSGSRRR